MVEQNSIECDEKKMPSQITIKRKDSPDKNETITFKIEKEYDNNAIVYNNDKNDFDYNHNDKVLDNYIQKLSDNEKVNLKQILLNKNNYKIFKIVLEKNDVNDLIRSMYYDKRTKMISDRDYYGCSNEAGRKIIPCVDNIISERYNIELKDKVELCYVYDILVVETKDIIPDVAEPDVAEPIVAQPIVALGGTRRRRNNKKNKRKTRNNRKKTNRRR